MTQITAVIFEYMQSHRRLTIPGLGSLLSRGGGAPLIFSEFAKSDDGVLRGELVKRGIAEVQAASDIEAFADDARERLSVEGGTITIEGIGTLVRRAVGVVLESAAISNVEVKVELQKAPAPQPILQPERQPEPEPMQQLDESEELEEDEEFEFEDYVEPTYNGEKKKRKFDPLVLFLIVAVVVAVSFFIRGFVISWSIGNIALPGKLDRVMVKIFGDGFDEVEAVDSFPVDEVE